MAVIVRGAALIVMAEANAMMELPGTEIVTACPAPTVTMEMVNVEALAPEGYPSEGILAVAWLGIVAMDLVEPDCVHAIPTTMARIVNSNVQAMELARTMVPAPLADWGMGSVPANPNTEGLIVRPPVLERSAPRGCAPRMVSAMLQPSALVTPLSLDPLAQEHAQWIAPRGPSAAATGIARKGPPELASAVVPLAIMVEIVGALAPVCLITSVLGTGVAPWDGKELDPAHARAVTADRIAPSSVQGVPQISAMAMEPACSSGKDRFPRFARASAADGMDIGPML
jgi:hypothetical protein